MDFKEQVFGFLAINKPLGMTSRQAVDTVKKRIRPTKIGHSGTLDPLAEGVLVMCLGPATRLASFVQAATKIYLADFQLGVSSVSDDTECDLIEFPDAPMVTQQQLMDTLPTFTGTISQIPPQYSAIKINGKRAYHLSRQGKAVDIQAREVQVYSIELLEFRYPRFRLRIECGAGTYIRSLGRDIGTHLGSAAVMTGLQRIQVGQFSLQDSIATSDDSLATLHQKIIPPIRVFDSLPHVCLSTEQQLDLSNGAIFSTVDLQPSLNRSNLSAGEVNSAGEENVSAGEVDVSSGEGPALATCSQIAAVNDDGQLLALLQRHHQDHFKPAINFVHYYQN